MSSFDPVEDSLSPTHFIRVLKSERVRGLVGIGYCWTKKAKSEVAAHGGLIYLIEVDLLDVGTITAIYFCHDCVGDYLVKKGLIW